MTDSHIGALRERTPGQLCFGFFALFCLFLILRNPDVAIEYITSGLRLCAVTVIPSLFPFLVLSELIVSGGIGRLLLRPVSGLLAGLFRLPPDGCCAILLGMFCGFPVGARAAVSAYDAGRLTRDEAERVICASTNPSSAFLLNAVGVSLHGNRRYGSALLTVTLLSALLIGILLGRMPKKDDSAASPAKSIVAVPQKSGARILYRRHPIRADGNADRLRLCGLFFGILRDTDRSCRPPAAFRSRPRRRFLRVRAVGWRFGGVRTWDAVSFRRADRICGGLVGFFGALSGAVGLRWARLPDAALLSLQAVARRVDRCGLSARSARFPVACHPARAVCRSLRPLPCRTRDNGSLPAFVALALHTEYKKSAPQRLIT